MTEAEREISMAQGAIIAGRQSRFWLYAPFVLLALLAIGWSAAWFMIRNGAERAVETWLAAEADDGRRWTCADRRIAGYPFRLELTCSSLRFQSGPVTGSAGPVQAVAQIYQPRHIITTVQGPLRFTDGRATVDANWRLLETSIRASRDGLRRASFFVEAPEVKVSGTLPEPVTMTATNVDVHLRPNPNRGASDGAVDLAARIGGMRLPALDAAIGGAEAADLQTDLTVTEAQGFATGVGVPETERWREAGGQVEVLLLSLAKGDRRLEARGNLRLDEERRPQGQLALAGRGLDGLIANLTGNQRAGGLIGALLGQVQARQPAQPAPQAGAPAATPGLGPLPPLRVDGGRLFLGPFAIPNVRIPPLY